MFIIKDATRDMIIAQGVLNGAVQIVEGQWYFRPEAVDMTNLIVTSRTYTCPYKGTCYWIDLNAADGSVIRNIGWVYFDVKLGYEYLKDWIAFYARDTTGTRAIESAATS